MSTEPIFIFSGEPVIAKRRMASFMCNIDGMTLRGMPMDWEIYVKTGTFPLPDHLFRLMFAPHNEKAQEAYNKTYTLTVAMTEGVKVGDKIEAIKRKITGK